MLRVGDIVDQIEREILLLDAPSQSSSPLSRSPIQIFFSLTNPHLALIQIQPTLFSQTSNQRLKKPEESLS